MDTYLYKLLTHDKQMRIYLIDNTVLLNALDEIHFESAAASDVFYTAITFCCHLHGIMTNAKRVSIKFESSDASAFLICGVDANGSIQGYASDDFRQKNYVDLSSIVGANGCLKIIQDNGRGTVFTGIIEIRENDISRSFANYFTQSEQIKTSFRYFRNIKDEKVLLSRGVLIQALPFADSHLISNWESHIDSHSEILNDFGASIEDIIKTAFSDTDVVEHYPLRLMCSCSREMILEMLLGLGVNELEWTMNDKQDIEVRCSKCGRRYSFGADEIHSLLSYS